jgi:hypothetical protein
VHLKEFLASAIVQINKMESCIASGIDDTRNIVSSPALFKRFGVARKKASTSLSTAEAFLEFTKQEPRLKGSFAGHVIVYKEVCVLSPKASLALLWLTTLDYIRPPPNRRQNGEYGPAPANLWLCSTRTVQL